jgi:hypothetical protein
MSYGSTTMTTVITLNLLAEEQQAQVARARDPVKLFTAIGLAVLTAAVAWGGTLSVVLMQKRSELQGLEARWSKMNNMGVEESEFQRVNALAEEIVEMNHSRIVLAPQWALVKDLIPPSVQLSQIALALSKETSGPEGGAEVRHDGRQRRSERLVLRMEGIASSSRPELEVDQFLKTLRNDARFGAVVDEIQLRSISRTSRDADKKGHAVAAAGFVIECWYKEMATK